MERFHLLDGVLAVIEERLVGAEVRVVGGVEGSCRHVVRVVEPEVVAGGQPVDLVSLRDGASRKPEGQDARRG